MLQGRSRTLLGRLAQLLPGKHFSIGSSKDLELPIRLFRTSSAARKDPAPAKLSKAALAEKQKKLERKRETRAVRRLEADAKGMESKVQLLQARLEVRDKADTAQQLADGLAPFSEEELDGMYRGLITAPPEELSSVKAIASPEQSLLLGAPGPLDAESRGERMSELEERLAERVEGADPVEGAELSLGERLKLRRKGVDTVEPVAKGDAAVAEDKESVVDAPGVEAAAQSKSAATILRRLEVIIEQAEGEGSSPLVRVPLGVAVRSEWRDLILSCVEQENMAGVMKVFELMDRSGVPDDGKLLNEVMATYASEGRARDCLALAKHCQESNVPVSVTTHHHLLSSLLPAHPGLAIKHLHSLEAAGHTPLLATYTLLIGSLIAPSSPSHLVTRGWDLYAHTRLVAHPIPSVELYGTMINACSTGPHPSPERAIDLFTEMTHDNRLPPSVLAYNGVIRSCAREGSQANYFEALRFMRQMLDLNVLPNRATFNYVLEGAKKQGDLARARWILVKMVALGGEATPDENTLALVFQTYASYRPPPNPASRPSAKRSAGRNANVVPPPPAASSDAIATSSSTPVLNVRPEETQRPTSDDLASLLDDGSLFFPGPLPQTPEQVIVEVQNLFLQAMGPDDAPSSMFPLVKPSTFLFNAYLSLLASHAPFTVALGFFNTIFASMDVKKNRYSYERIMNKCETVPNRELATESAREIFTQWIHVSREEQAETEEAEQRGELLSKRGQFGDGKSISKIWCSLIKVLARNYAEQEAIQLLQTFIATYPPTNLLAQSQQLRKNRRALPAIPSPIVLSDPLYPETTSSSISNGTGNGSRPPFILFEDIKLLHMRLANVEDEQSIKTVAGICRAYSTAIRECEDFESNIVRVKHVPVVLPPVDLSATVAEIEVKRSRRAGRQQREKRERQRASA